MTSANAAPSIGATPPTDMLATDAQPASFTARLKRAFDLEHHFEKIARAIVVRPYKFLAASLVLTLLLGGGWSFQFNETRPEKQWVPRTAIALEHKDYVDVVWPGELSFSAWIATPAVEGGNMLDAKVLKELRAIEEKVKTLSVDGGAAAVAQFPNIDAATLAKVEGDWSYEGTGRTERKCFRFGPTCGQTSILAIFNDDRDVISRLNNEAVLRAVNFWEDQKQKCVVSIAAADSPCADPSAWVSGASKKACQAYDTAKERADCREAAELYCDEYCSDPDDDACEDGGCKDVLFFKSVANSSMAGAQLAFLGDGSDFEPFALKTVASSGNGPKKDADGDYTRADALRGAFFLESSQITVGGDAVDVVGDAWEKEALCAVGIPAGGYTTEECPLPEHVRFTALFSRSFSDEFGGAINSDLVRLGAAVVGIAAYMILMISPCDPVHSKIGLSLATVLITLLSYVCTTGLGSYVGIFTSQLSNLVPFLLLGLGVDDAFVLVGEYNRATLINPTASAEERCIAATKHGGVSILITSLTDALAFLVGSSTVLPALESFCLYAGMGIVFCFAFQLTIFLPVLLLDARRVERKRYDMLCCLSSSKEHPFDDPRGGCCVAAATGVKFPNNTLERGFGAFARTIITRPGKALVLAVFAAIFAIGATGASRIYADFRLEWFIPDNSYVQSFFTLNDALFAQGTPFSVYTVEGDYFAQQRGFKSLSAFLNSTKYVDQNEDVSDWSAAFLTYAKETDSSWLDRDGLFKREDVFYRQLLQWLHGAGREFSSAVKWVDTKCDDDDEYGRCQQELGLRATRISAVTALEQTNVGRDRYNTLVALREAIDERVPGAFPYSGTFLFWEETGSIDRELVRNLLICAAVIIVVIGLLIPEKRSAALVVMGVLMAVVEVVGYLHWWGVTISGVSTIYILISVGLTVDYSAHIAHIFVLETGSADERAIKALSRIGPSVFNAVASTLVAVLALSTSASYVFRVFFQALCLTVVLGGAHGLVLLPVLLSLVGGKLDAPGVPAPIGKVKVAEADAESATESAVKLPPAKAVGAA
ncbi:hypothetical protein KFE25_005281 [Diacronema lutheri]|uniref:SSD domain-containing protein n=1 Tax=Diacronema lutheri TaxID=2081491 RepID=A0A8J5X8Z4_DIALT|nr:hypothetical protein KFE25_012883 [Diacronema lutheri]KAG8458854.1 hypothetical protein KFE25_005281 [Diacronema lutheri]